jgi:excisionase family DNA binding protein
MTALSRQFNPSEVPSESLERLAFALIGQLDKIGITDRPMRIKEAAEWMGVSQKHVHHLINIGALKAHRLEEKGNPFLLRSEIIERIKKS